MVMKPQVIDAFMFNNELDVLNFRLHELNEHVDKFVIYENSWTFSGNKKPLYFEENKEMFSKFSGKIVHIKSNTRGKNNWKSEYSQRHEVLAKGVSSLNLNNKDVVSFCDLDEIIDPKLQTRAAPRCTPFSLSALVQRILGLLFGRMATP